MILAAGHGKRMHPLTLDSPKPLLLVGGKPIIVWNIERLVDFGVEKIVINHSFLGKKIENYLGDGSTWGVKIVYSPEPKALDTGGGIFNALSKIETDIFFVINGDILSDFSFERLGLDKNDLAQIVLVPNPNHNLDGDFSLNKGRLTSLKKNYGFTFSGIGIYRKTLFKNCVLKSFPLAPILQNAADDNLVGGILHTGNWIDIGTPQRLFEANEFYEKN